MPDRTQYLRNLFLLKTRFISHVEKKAERTKAKKFKPTIDRAKSPKIPLLIIASCKNLNALRYHTKAFTNRKLLTEAFVRMKADPLVVVPFVILTAIDSA